MESLAVVMIDKSHKIGHDNSFLDLSQEKVRFNVDHLFRIPQTTKSLVFFPYHINPDEIHDFNEYCKANDYSMDFVGGESQYGGKSDMTNGTMTILLIHKDDENINKFEFLARLELLKVS